MRRILCIFLCCILGVSLCACGVKEASSETEAKRIVITVFSDLSEISKQLDTEYISSANLKRIEKRLNDCLADIHSTDRYKSIDSIKSDYEKALKLYNEVKKEYDVKYKETLEIEKKVKK